MSRKTRAVQTAERRSAGGLFSRYPREICICLGLIVAIWLVFGQEAHFQFVNWDDDNNIYNNPPVLAGLTLKSIVWALTDSKLDYWHPIPWLSHMLDVQLFGGDAGWHHLTSVFIHMLNALLVFLILRRMTGAVWKSGIVAALFAIHPLRAESVAWVTERKDVLGGLFWWLTTWAYVEYTKNTASRKKYGLVILLFFMALMSKPTVMTLPFFLLLLDYWPLKRLWGQSGLSTRDTPDCPHVLVEKIPLFALSAIFVALTFVAQRAAGSMDMIDRVPLPLRLANCLVSYAAYLRDMVWPAHLAAIYPYDRNLPASQVAAAALLLAAVTAFVLWKASRFRYLAVGWFWYLGVLVPVSGLIQMGLQSRADRFTYVPLVGVFVLIVWGLDDLMAGWRHRTAAAVAMAAIALPALGVRAWSQVGIWSDSITMFRQTVDATRGNHWAMLNLAVALDHAGREEESLGYLHQVLRLDPNSAMAYDDEGNILLRQGKLEEALVCYDQELRIKPDQYGHYHRGEILYHLGRKREAFPEIQEALRLGGMEPGFTLHARTDFGTLLAEQGRLAEAVSQFNGALSIDPNFAPARKGLAIALMKMGSVEEARKQFALLVALDPADNEARAFLNRLAAAK